MEDTEIMRTEELQEEAVKEAEEKETVSPRAGVGFWKDNRGIGVIEIVLILVVLIGLVLVFKEQITAIVNNAFTALSGDAGKIIN